MAVRPVTTDDVKITDARYGLAWPLWRCADCRYVFAPDALQNRLNEVYQEMTDEAYEDGASYRQRQQQSNLSELIRVAGRVPATLLDIGCGTGLLLAAARERGMTGVGVEPSRWAVARAQARGLDVKQGFYPHPEVEGTFEAIALIDLIEHVTDPRALLGAAARQLAPGGVLQVITPDIDSWASRIMGRRWWHCRLAHVGFFNRVSMAELAGRCGLEPVAVRRAKWYFSVGYVLERLTAYTPRVDWAGLGRRHGLLRRWMDKVFPLNLLDSYSFYLRRKP